MNFLVVCFDDVGVVYCDLFVVGIVVCDVCCYLNFGDVLCIIIGMVEENDCVLDVFLGNFL